MNPVQIMFYFSMLMASIFSVITAFLSIEFPVILVSSLVLWSNWYIYELENKVEEDSDYDY